MQRQKLSRRYIMQGVAGVSTAGILHWPANAAEFSYKLGSSSPMEHPAMARQQIAADRIKKETNGRLEITIYPNSVLGGDTAMITVAAVTAAVVCASVPGRLRTSQADRHPCCGLSHSANDLVSLGF